MDKRKILFLNLETFSNTGGIQNYNKMLLKALDLSDYNTISVSIYDEKDIKDEFSNIKIYNFNKHRIKATLFILRNFKKIDKVILTHINLIPVALLLKILNPDLNFYLCIYGIEVWRKLSFCHRLFFIFKKIKILSISNYTTNMFMKFNNVKKELFFYLPPTILINSQKEVLNPYKEKEYNILSISRLDDNYKGIDSMIKTLPFLVNIIPNIRYTVIGNGINKKKLEELAYNLHVSKYIDFKGFIEELTPFYKYCDVFVLPSKGEGFGIVYLEAMRHKKPCIGCNAGGVTDVIVDNVTGFLCEYDDVKCLMEKILLFHKDRNMSIKFGENGYKRVIENFIFEKFQERLKNILDN